MIIIENLNEDWIEIEWKAKYFRIDLWHLNDNKFVCSNLLIDSSNKEFLIKFFNLLKINDRKLKFTYLSHNFPEFIFRFPKSLTLNFKNCLIN
jgi:hypothetical protein